MELYYSKHSPYTRVFGLITFRIYIEEGKYSLCYITNETFFILDRPIKNETFTKEEIIISVLFPLSYFILSLLTHKTTLHKISCQNSNVSILL